MADEEQQGPPPPPAVGAESAGEWADARESVQHVGTLENAALRGASLSAFPSHFGSTAFERPEKMRVVLPEQRPAEAAARSVCVDATLLTCTSVHGGRVQCWALLFFCAL
jgi:hypothetical protein